MPTNAFLISGPSKTADIELTLAFSVHGPKELIVLVVDDSAQRSDDSDQIIEDGNRNSEDERGQGDLRRSLWNEL
jgi:hypothetical protein